MRDVVLQIGITLDGFVHGDRGYDDWGLPPEDNDLVAWKTASLRSAGTHAMGRRTYDDMVQVWPTGTGVYADAMNAIPKVVFSTSLTEPDWAGTRVAGGDLRTEIERLRSEEGGLILVHGGQTLIDSLVTENLIDEYRLVIHPVAIGHGVTLFRALDQPLRLDVLESLTFPTGTKVEVCRPHGRERP